METKGFTFNGIAGRIRDLETKTNGAYYVCLCWLAMTRNSGKGSRKLLESKVFGQDKPTSTFRNAWRIAEKSFAEGFHKGHRQSVDGMLLDDAVEFAMAALEAHKAALGARRWPTMRPSASTSRERTFRLRYRRAQPRVRATSSRLRRLI